MSSSPSNANGVSDEVRWVMAQFERTPDGSAVILESGDLLTFDEAVEWRRSYDLYNNRFFHWCQSNALIVGEFVDAKEYFGPTGSLLDFESQRIIWERYFESRLEGYVTGGACTAKMLEEQLLFEAHYGLANIGNPFLFPSRKYLIEELGGFDYTGAQSARAVPSRPGGESSDYSGPAARMKRVYEDDRASVLHVIEMAKSAARRFVSGDYDGRAVFEGYRAVIMDWAEKSYFGHLENDFGQPTKERIVSRVAIMKMVNAESDILAEISQYTNAKKTIPSEFDRDKASQLRKGSIYRP